MKQGGSWGGYGVKAEGSSRYQNRRANDVRVNIDALRDNNTSDDLANGSKSPANLPVGIIRVEHKDEELKVATSAELEAEEQEDDDDNDLFVSAPADAPAVKDDEVWTTGSEKPGEKDLQIKPEPGMEDDAMEIDNIPKAPDSPELKKKPLVQDLEKDAKEKAKEKKRERALQDPESQAMAMDAAALLRGLSLTEGEESERDNKLFLFQFPPILPPLVRVNEDGSEFIDLEDGQGENGSVKVKTEPGTTGHMATSSMLPPGGGYIGRLNVRKSGKVELDWGGQLLDLGIATETDFLTTAIIVDEQENDTASGQGKATGMGQIYGKFVATPIFKEENEWDPDLDAFGLSV
jgi:DNA-directed RNA polymerase III subunit RPC4